MNPLVVGIAGWKNSGKTTLTSRLVAEFAARGLKVATVKHAHHDFDVDHEGTDSFRHRMAGAGEVAIVSARRWAIMHELRDETEPALEEVLARLSPCDIVLVEGYKRASIPKIEVRRREAADSTPLSPGDASVIAIATDDPGMQSHVPVFDLDHIRAIADFIAARRAAGP